MSEDKVTYVELKLPKSKKQDKRNPAHKRKEFPWHIIAGSLGVLCFFLLATTVYFYLQSSCTCERTCGPEGNVTSSPDLTSTVDHHLPPIDKQNPSNTCLGKWSCCGKRCYYFSEEEKSWDESKLSCEAKGSHLIKIDNQDKQKFIQQRTLYNYWIGLRKKGDNHPWLWLDSDPLFQKLAFQQTTANAKCGFIKSTIITTAPCKRQLPYICEKIS